MSLFVQGFVAVEKRGSDFWCEVCISSTHLQNSSHNPVWICCGTSACCRRRWEPLLWTLFSVHSLYEAFMNLIVLVKICFTMEWSGGLFEFWFWPSHYRLCPICLANVNTARYRHQGVNEDIATCYPFINWSQLIFDLLRITAKTNKGMLKGFEAVS